MRAIVMRVLQASVSVEGEIISEIGKGLLVLVGFGKEDAGEQRQTTKAAASCSSSSEGGAAAGTDETDLRWMASRLAKCGYWPDEQGHHWSRSVGDVGGDVLIVSQFTLFGVLSKGSKPTFHRSLAPADAQRMYDRFIALVQEELPSRRVLGGSFGSMMAVSNVNDGPVTFVLDSRDRNR